LSAGNIIDEVSFTAMLLPTAGEGPAEVLTRTGRRTSGPWQVLGYTPS
jgi:hypothetical protein